MLPVHNFQSGLATPVAGYLISCLGAFLALRCTTRARVYRGPRRARWLLVAGISLGTTGIWVMHFIAMLGFAVPGQTIRYNVPVTILSMLIAVAVVTTGLLIVGYGDRGYRRLAAGGVFTGLGVASMHYTGMAAMRIDAAMSYNVALFALSAIIAIIAATAALWAALRLNGIWHTVGAALIMGAAVSGMHYTGMAAMRLYPAGGSAGMIMGGAGGATAASFLLPLILGITISSFLLTATVASAPTPEEVREEQEMLARARSHGLQV